MTATSDPSHTPDGRDRPRPPSRAPCREVRPPATGEGTPRYLWALAAASGIAVAGLFLVIGLTRARRRTGTSPPVPTTGPERQPIQSSPPT